MCQFGIIYYHFFQRRQTYIRQFFTPSALQYLSTYSTTASNCDLDCSEFSSLCLYTKFFFQKNQVHIYQTVYHLHHLCSRGCRNIPTGTIQISHYFRPANKPGPVLLFLLLKEISRLHYYPPASVL